MEDHLEQISSLISRYYIKSSLGYFLEYNTLLLAIYTTHPLGASQFTCDFEYG